MKTETPTISQFEVAGHKIPPMNGLAAAFGADLSAYPNLRDLPEDYRSMRAPGCKVFDALFFSGGKLSDHGLALKPGVDEKAFYTTLRALMASFAPKHEVKSGTCGLLIDTYTVKGGAA